MEGSGVIMALLLLAGLSATGYTVARTRGVRGSGRLQVEEHEVRNCHSVTFAAIGQLILEENAEEGLRIEAEDNLLPYFETEIYGSELRIRQSLPAPLRPTRPVRFFLQVKSLEGLTVRDGIGN